MLNFFNKLLDHQLFGYLTELDDDEIICPECKFTSESIDFEYNEVRNDFTCPKCGDKIKL